jgi:D-alanyl-D-alanine carboxypeptidase
LLNNYFAILGFSVILVFMKKFFGVVSTLIVTLSVLINIAASPVLALSSCYMTASGVNVSKFSGATKAADLSSTCLNSSPNTRYGVASVSKMITSLTVLSLVDEGKISLDSPFIGQLAAGTMKKPSDTRWNKITVRQLLNHTSGIQVSKNWYFSQTTAAKYNYDWRNIAKNATSISLQSTPGRAYQYSNTNYTILGLLIDQKAEKPYLQAASEKVFQPLGLGSAEYMLNSEQALTTQDFRYYGYAAWKNKALGPAGAWFLTPHAASILPIAFKKLLSPTLSSQAMKGSTANSAYGLGLMKMPGGWGHTGTITGVRAAVAYNISSGKSGAVLYNGANFSSGSDLKYAAYKLTTKY